MNPTNKNHIEKGKESYTPQKDRSFKAIALTLVGFFIGAGLVVFFYDVTLINSFDLSKFIIGFIVIGFLIPLKYYQKWFQFIRYEILIFNLMIGPLLTGVFLTLNFLISSNPTTETYKIEKQYFITGYQGFGTIQLKLENNAFFEQKKVTHFDDKQPYELAEYNYLQITLSKGLFGYQIIKERTLLK